MAYSERLEQIAGLVPQGARVIDVGTDHGLLPILLTERQRVSSVIAADVNAGPLAAARANVRARGFDRQIEIRLGSGLTVVEPGEVDTAVIAGMGGPLIADILRESPPVMAQLRHLILQPMIAAGRVRAWLAHNGWHIRFETVFADAGRMYELIHAEVATDVDEYAPYRHSAVELEAAYDYGPLLLAGPDEAFIRFMEEQYERLEQVWNGLQDAAAPQADRRKTEIDERMRFVQSWLNHQS